MLSPLVIDKLFSILHVSTSNLDVYRIVNESLWTHALVLYIKPNNLLVDLNLFVDTTFYHSLENPVNCTLTRTILHGVESGQKERRSQDCGRVETLSYLPDVIKNNLSYPVF